MNLEEAISDLKEIVELAEPELSKGDENICATLDLTELQALKIVLEYVEG